MKSPAFRCKKAKATIPGNLRTNLESLASALASWCSSRASALNSCQPCQPQCPAIKVAKMCGSACSAPDPLCCQAGLTHTPCPRQAMQALETRDSQTSRSNQTKHAVSRECLISQVMYESSIKQPRTRKVKPSAPADRARLRLLPTGEATWVDRSSSALQKAILYKTCHELPRHDGAST